MKLLRVPREIDRSKFIPLDFSIPRSHRYTDVDGVTQPYKHIRVISARNVAKTYGEMVTHTEIALRGHIAGDPNRTFMYMRRGVDELENAFPTLYKEIREEFPEIEFRQRGDRWEARPWDSPASSWRTICYGVALREAYKKRSSFWNDVRHVMFDEFIDDGSLPLSNEITTWNSIYDTMARNRPVTTSFMANPQFMQAGVTNPYFQDDGLVITPKMPEFIRKPAKSTLYWFPKAGVFGNQEETARMREVAGTGYGQMSNGGEFVHAYAIPVGKRGSSAKPFVGLKVNGQWYSAWVQDTDDYIYLERGVPNDRTIERFAFTPPDIEMASKENRGTRLASKGRTEPALAIIKQAWTQGGVYFRDTAVNQELSVLFLK